MSEPTKKPIGRPPGTKNKPKEPEVKEELPLLHLKVMNIYEDGVAVSVNGSDKRYSLSIRNFASAVIAWGYSPTTGGKFPGKIVDSRVIIGN